MKQLITVIIGLVLLTGCTENRRAKAFGGTQTISLPPGKQLVTATWKENDLWYVTIDRPTNQPPRVSVFQEKSSFGLLEGKIVFQEQ